MTDDWDYIGGGCGLPHPFDKEKRAERQACLEAKRSSKPKSMDSQADLILAQAAADKANQPSNSWTPTQILMVTGGSILALTIMIVVIKKATMKK